MTEGGRVEANGKTHENSVYYMAESASVPDEANPAFLLATRAGKMAYLARSGFPALVPQVKILFGHILNPLLPRRVRSRWLDREIFV